MDKDNSLCSNVLEYALNIIAHTPKFHDFAMAIMDYNPDASALIVELYQKMYSLDLPSEVKEQMTDFRYGEHLQKIHGEQFDEWYRGEYKKWKEARQKELCQEIKDNVDDLQHLIEDFRSTERFKQMLDFVGKFHYLAPFNAMLVQMQKPGASFVFTGRRWMTEYNRQPKPNAQQLITLVPFGPVQVMFDFDDTEQIPGTDGCAEKSDLMEQWESILTKTQGTVDQKIMTNLLNNLPNYGIRYDANFIASDSYGGYLLKTTQHEVTIRINKERSISHKARFVLSVNKRQSEAAMFHTICHELGHLFCRHLFYDAGKARSFLSQKEEEFEAETVAWLVCKRHGISNPSEEYLATYAPSGEIPECSIEVIMKAVTEIEKMLAGTVSFKKALWYPNDKNVKSVVDNHKD